ncbi:TonB-dependent receptor, partial [candidate division KSB1 bacterium]|nr:TonB-dependent receptor [candidate division KSB1 bacterium]
MKNVFFFVTMLTGLVLAQSPRGSISGTVVDTQTKEPLIGVNVLVLDTQYGASTDLEGRYFIENVPVGAYRLRFDYIGYESLLKTDIIVRTARAEVVDAQLKQSMLEGEEIVVTAGYFADEERVQPSTIGLSREEIRRFPGGFEDVVRTVSTLPGVAINNAGGRNDLLVRGGGPSENLFVINGIEVPNINHFGNQGTSSGSLSFVNLDFVQDVTFSTGGFGARYGDKMSSVLTLQMSEGYPTAFEPKVTISASQYGADFELPLQQRGNLIFSARKSYLDLIFKAAGLAFVPVYTDFNLIGHYDLSPKDKLFFISLSAINDVDRDLSTPQNRVENAGILGNDQYQAIAGLSYRRILNSGYLDAVVGTNLFKYGFKQAEPAGDVFFQSDAREREANLKLERYWVASKKLGVRAGLASKTIFYENNIAFADTIYDRSGNRIAVDFLGVPQTQAVDTTAQKFSGYAEVDWNASTQFEINAGVRADYFGFLADELYPAPRLSFKYKLTPQHSIKLSGGLYYQSPSYVWMTNPNNKNLKALKNTMGVLGWDYLAQEDVRFSVETYYKRYDDLPTGTAPGLNDYIVITNTGTSYGGATEDFQSFGYFDMASNGYGRSYGVEFLLQKKFSGTPYYGLASLTLNKTDLTANNGITYPGQYDQRFILNISGGYKPNPRWEFSAKFRYFTGVPYTPVYRKGENPANPNEIQNLPEDYLAARLNAAHHLDVRVDRYFNFGASTLTVYLDVQNLYNYAIPLRPS